MRRLIVLENPSDWPLDVPDTAVVPAKLYLTDPKYSQMKSARVFNLCTSYRYQSLGYYVSLVAAARGHKPMPSIATIQDLKAPPTVRVIAEDLDELIQKTFSKIKSGSFTLSSYFGRNVAKRYDPLCHRLFTQFPAPLLRASFDHNGKGWVLDAVRPIAISEIPGEHREFVLRQTQQYFSRPHRVGKVDETRETLYDLAILHNPKEANKPSNERAIKKFIKAAEDVGFAVELLEKDELYERLAEFDAIFLRETTSVNHHTYRLARRAVAEGLIVVDDPESILRCSNKVFLAEALERHRLATPRTAIISRDTAASVEMTIGFPCVLKQPDSSFSQGVIKVPNEATFAAETDRLFRVSELLIVQEFVPTEFDWRVGVLDGEALYVCKYWMAQKHWQIVSRKRSGEADFGRVETLPVEKAPSAVVRLGVRAARMIGRGLFGVDIKEIRGKPVVIEVNDNPSIDAGCEDGVLKDDLYRRIMKSFADRIEAARKGDRR